MFGDQKVESSSDDNADGLAEAFPFAGHSSGTAHEIEVYVDSKSTARSILAALYADSHGTPGALLAAGKLSAPKAGAWNQLPISATKVSATKSYWLAVLGTGGTMYFRDRASGPCTSINSRQTDLRSLPSTWRDGSEWSTCPVSAYVAGTVSAVSSGVNPPTTTTTATTPTTTTITSTPLPTLPVPPVNLFAPQVSGTAMQDQTLTTDNGTWLNGPTSYGYQWQDCDTSGANCANISGATSNAHTLTGSDVGHTVRVVVTGSNPGGSASSTSSQTDTVQPLPAPTNTALPTITGTATQGQALTASNGSWTGSPSGYALQWQDCNSSGASCASISGATGSTYTLTSSDVSHTIRVVVTATNDGGSTSATSSQTSAVQPPPAPTNSALPTISGTATQGQTLTAAKGTWTGNPSSYAYQWRDCDSSGANCTSISGATGTTYALTSNDVSHTIRIVVTATNSAGSTPATSVQSSVVSGTAPSAPSNTALPAITGNDQVGSQLSASQGTWTGSPTSYTYQWEDCNSSGASCANVSGATNSVYTLASGDSGHTMRVVVTASNQTGSGSATSVATSTVTTASSGSCTTTLSSGNVESAVASVANGGTVCLNAGSYSWSGSTTKSAMTTVTTAPGVSRSQVTLSSASLGYSTNVALVNLTMGGGDVSNSAQHIRFENDDITSNLHVADGPNLDVLIDGNTFEPLNNCGSSTYEGHIEITGGTNNKTVNGIVISNNTILGGDGDGIQNGGYGTQIGPGNDISGQLQNGSCHADGIQLYGSSHTLIEDNYLHNNTDGIMACGTTSSVDINSETIRDNVINTNGYDAICFGSNSGTSVIDHNTLMQGGNPGAIRMCSQPSCYGTSSGTTISNNIGYGWYVQNGDSAVGVTSFNNLFSNGNAGTNGMTGSPTYTGGAHPSTWSGFELTSGSLGVGAASDGTNVGSGHFQ